MALSDKFEDSGLFGRLENRVFSCEEINNWGVQE